MVSLSRTNSLGSFGLTLVWCRCVSQVLVWIHLVQVIEVGQKDESEGYKKCDSCFSRVASLNCLNMTSYFNINFILFAPKRKVKPIA